VQVLSGAAASVVSFFGRRAFHKDYDLVWQVCICVVTIIQWCRHYADCRRTRLSLDWLRLPPLVLSFVLGVPLLSALARSTLFFETFSIFK
jgi:hypothetical protein